MAYSGRELEKLEFPPQHHLVGSGLLSQRSILVVGGPPKSMKSMITLGACMNLASASPLFNAYRMGKHGYYDFVFPVARPCKVLVIEQEVGYEDMQDRYRTMLAATPTHLRDAIQDNLFIESCNRDMRLDTEFGTGKIRALVREIKPDVLCIDPLKEFHQVDENSSRDMGIVFGNIDSLRLGEGLTVIINHHRTKPSKDGDDDGPDALRGSSYIFGKADSVMMLRPDKRTQGRIRCTFTLRRGKPIAGMHVQVNTDTLRTEFICWDTDPSRKEKLKDGPVQLDDMPMPKIAM